MVCLSGSVCCAVELFLCQPDEVCVCSHIEAHAGCQPAPLTASICLLSSLSAAFTPPPLRHRPFVCSRFSSRGCSPPPLLSLVLHPLPLSLSPPPFIALPLSLYLCVFCQWYRRSALRPHSSLWQPQPPDERKQIPQQEPDIKWTGLFFFSCHVFCFSFLLRKRPRTHCAIYKVKHFTIKYTQNHKILSRYQGICK